MNLNELLKDTILGVKHCQKAIICSSDGLLVSAFPETDMALNEALSASATSILGITSSVTQRAGKTGNDYVLIKNSDSFLLVFFLENCSLFLIADSNVNLGMLLHKGKKLRTKIAEKMSDEPEISKTISSFQPADKVVSDSIVFESQKTDDEVEVIHQEPEVSEPEIEVQVEAVELEPGAEITNPDEIIKLVETEEAEREIENPDEIISLVDVEEELDKLEEEEATLENKAEDEAISSEEVPYEPTHEDATEADDVKIEFRFSDEPEEELEEDSEESKNKEDDDSNLYSYDNSTDAIKIVYDSDDKDDEVEEENSIDKKTNIIDLNDTNLIEKISEESKRNESDEDGFQSFISWRERLQKEKESIEESDDEDSARDLFDGI